LKGTARIEDLRVAAVAVGEDLTDDPADKMLSFPTQTQPPGQTMHVPAVPMAGDDRMTVDGHGFRFRPAPDRRRAIAAVLPYGERRAVFR